jgi:hypothetical protein
MLDGHRVDGFPGFRVGGAFGPDNPAGLGAGKGDEAGCREGKKRFSVHNQTGWFPIPKMGKKTGPANSLTRFVYSNTQIFVHPCEIVSNFAKKGVGFLFNFKIFYKHPPET